MDHDILISQMYRIVESFNDYKNLVIKYLSAICSKTDIPLEKRWNLFCKCNIGISKPFIYHFEALSYYLGKHNTLEDRILSDYTRYQEIKTIDLIEDIEIKLHQMGMTKDIIKDIISLYKEEVMKNMIISFKFDW